MAIRYICVPNLDRREIWDFFHDPDPARQSWQDPAPAKVGYTLSAKPGKTANLDEVDGKPLLMYWAVRETYEVLEAVKPTQDQVVGSFTVDVPVEQAFTLTVASVLLVKDGIAPEQRALIETTFENYDYTISGDPREFCRKQLAAYPDIQGDFFEIVPVIGLRKVGDPVPHPEQRQALLAAYNGTAQVVPGPNQPAVGDDFFRKRGLSVRQLQPPHNLDGVPSPARDLLHERVASDAYAEDVIKDIVRVERQALDCFDIAPWKEKILTLAKFPEFRIVWRDFQTEIGCGVTIILRLPVLQIRISALNLYAYAGIPPKLGDLVVRVIEACLWRAALSGAVVGVVLGNFIAALQAFRGVFTECIKEKFAELIKCLIPGLALITDVDEDWH